MSQQYICQLSSEAVNHAQNVLKESEDTRRIGFTEISNWAAENPELHVRIEERHILQFLRRCKFDLEKTKVKLRNYYTMKRDRTDWFTNRNPQLPEIRALLKLGCFLVLRETYKNQLVVIVKATKHDPKIHSLENVFKTGLMVLDVAMMEEELAQVYGVITIIDLTNVSIAHAKQLSISRIRHMVYAWENYHCRPQQMHFINAPIYVNVVLNVFRSFMSEKLKNRIHVRYKGNSSLQSIIDKEILLQDYGGNGESADTLANYWLEKLNSYTDWFAEDEKYKAEAQA